MGKENEQRIKEKLEFFMNQQIKVHVELLDRTFLNGLVVKKVKENVYWLVEDKLGEIFLFLKDIYDIDSYKEKEVEI